MLIKVVEAEKVAKNSPVRVGFDTHDSKVVPDYDIRGRSRGAERSEIAQ